MLDLLIRNGLVFDGLGSPPIQADIGIQSGKIVAIAPKIDSESQEIIDATGLWIAPGFIDIHTHYDLELEIAPGLSESVRHGVTSVVIGNCSLSATVGSPQVLADIFQRVETLAPELIAKWLHKSQSWQTPAAYWQHLHDLPLGPNIAPLLGHSALRAHVMGLDRSITDDPTPDDLATMKALAQSALDSGFIGISIDMFPWHLMSGKWRGKTIPSQHAKLPEYAMLADLCRERDVVFQVTPNVQRLASFVDLFRLGLGIWRRPLRMTVLSALDAVHDRRLWRVFSPILYFLNRVLGGNVRFQTIAEPFTIYGDGPLTPLFEEVASGVQLNSCDSRLERAQLWASPGFRDRFRQEWLGGWRKSFHRQLDLMTIVQCPEPSWEGLSFAAVAANAGQDPIDFFITALEKYDTDIRWMATGANDRLEPRLALLQHPHIFPGFTDAGAHVRSLGYYDGALSLLKQAVSTGFLTSQSAIARVTGEPAQWFRLDTGVLKIGAKADLVLLNPTALNQPISPQIEIADPLLDGTPRMVKRGSDEIVVAVYIKGVKVIDRGQVSDRLGKERLGKVLAPHHFKLPEPISDRLPDHPFTDYWDIFVLKHQHPVNIGLHILGICFFYGLLITTWQSHNLWLLWGLPLTQFFGLLGHWLFESSYIDRRDALFSWRASFCLGKMLVRLVTGKYRDDVRDRQQSLQDYLKNRTQIECESRQYIFSAQTGRGL
jgi:N-acyl-D-aspartate/D-glutamate deacylase